MDSEDIAQRLKAARQYKGWTQTELARRSGLHSVQISKLERGITQVATSNTIRALCRTLEISADYLLGLSGQREMRKS